MGSSTVYANHYRSPALRVIFCDGPTSLTIKFLYAIFSAQYQTKASAICLVFILGEGSILVCSRSFTDRQFAIGDGIFVITNSRFLLRFVRSLVSACRYVHVSFSQQGPGICSTAYGPIISRRSALLVCLARD